LFGFNFFIISSHLFFICSEVAHIHACGHVVAATSVRFGLVAVRAFVTI